VKERDRFDIDPFVKEMLLIDPEFVAWLAPHDEDDEVDDDEHAAAA
jgi:hypothetical protein